MALLLTACATNNDIDNGDLPLAVHLPKICEGFLVPVKTPVVTPKTDARVAYTKTADALDNANTRLSIGGDCVRDERSLFSNLKPAK